MAVIRKEDIEDILENVIAKIYAKYKSLEIDNVLAYVYRMLENEIKDYWKKKTKESTLYTDTEKGYPEEISYDQSIEDIMTTEDMILHVQKALQKLRSPKQQKIFELKLKGYESKEIMDKMKLSRSAYDTIVFRAKQDIKKYLIKQEYAG